MIRLMLYYLAFLITVTISQETESIQNKIALQCGNQECLCCSDAQSCICKDTFIANIEAFKNQCKRHVCIVTNNPTLNLPNRVFKCSEDGLKILAMVEKRGNTYFCQANRSCEEMSCMPLLPQAPVSSNENINSVYTPVIRELVFEQRLEIVSSTINSANEIKSSIVTIWNQVFEMLNIQFPEGPKFESYIRGRDGKIYGLRYTITGEDISAKPLLEQYKILRKTSENNGIEKTIGFPTLTKECDKDCEKLLKCGENAKVDYAFGEIICQCLPDYSGDPNIKCVGICTETVIPTDIGDLTFVETWGGLVSLSKEKCSNGYPLASTICRNSPPFEFSKEIVYFDCGVDIHTVVIMAYNDTLTLEIACSYLQILTSNSNDLTSEDVNSVVNFMENVTEDVNVGIIEVSSVSILRSLVLISSQLAEGYWRPDPVKKATETADFRTSDNELRRRIASYIPDLAIRSNVFQNKSDMFTMETDSLYMQITQSSDVFDNGDAHFHPIIRKNNGSMEESPVTLVVPSEVTEKAWSNENATELTQRRTCFILYKSDTFIHTTRNISYILSVDIGINVTLNNLKQPITMIHEGFDYTENFQPFENSTTILRQKPKCVFWDFEKDSWSGEGCYYTMGTNPPECKCHHLTNFAVLVATELDTKDTSALNIVTIVGCSLSIAGLIFTSIVIASSRDLRITRSGKILLNICINLAISYLVFVTGISSYEIEWACILVTALLHYFFLITWFWMAIYSYDMYNSLVRVFSSYQTKFMLRSGLLAYGIPLLIVIITFGVTVGQQIYNGVELTPSNYHRENVCWLLDVPLYASFLAPVGILLCFNCFVFAIVTWELYKQNKKAHSETLKRTAKQSLLISSTMTFIMGITWVFGYLTLISTNEVYLLITSWLFAVTNAFQGVGIFILTTLRRDDMRKVWWTPIKRLFSRNQSQPRDTSLRLSSTSTATSGIGKLSSRR